MKLTKYAHACLLIEHNWHWRPEALSAMYEYLQASLVTEGIDFKILKDGETLEL